MKTKFYIISCTTAYGNYHRPIYIETEYGEAVKMKNALQKLYDQLRCKDIAKYKVASIFTIEKELYWYDGFKTSAIYSRKPIICITDLSSILELYDINHKDAANRMLKAINDPYKKASLFTLDYNKEVEEIRAQIASATATSDDDDDWI